MNHATIVVLLFFLFFTADVSAQKSKLKSIKWDIAGVLPSNDDKALGFAGSIVGMHNDVLIVGGGSNFPDSMPWLGGKKKYYADLYVFKKNENDSLIFFKSFKLPSSLAYSANVSTPNGIVVVGGEYENGISNKVVLIGWKETTQSLTIKNLPDLPFAVTNASAAWHNNKIYVAGGEMKNEVSDRFLLLDLDNVDAGWNNLPSLQKSISHSVMLVQSNGKEDCIYVIGGRKKNSNATSDLYSSVLQFNLTTNRWTEKKSLPYTLSAGTGVALKSNSILVFGGDNGATFHKTEQLITSINNETNEEKQKQLTIEKIKLQSSHPGFCKGVLLYNTGKDAWSIAGCIPFDSPVTTTAVKWNNEVIIPGGEIKAGVRTPQILSAKIIF